MVNDSTVDQIKFESPSPEQLTVFCYDFYAHIYQIFTVSHSKDVKADMLIAQIIKQTKQSSEQGNFPTSSSAPVGKSAKMLQNYYERFFEYFEDGWDEDWNPAHDLNEKGRDSRFFLAFQAETMHVLQHLTGDLKRELLHTLDGYRLINDVTNYVISLRGADLSKANLHRCALGDDHPVGLSGAILREAILDFAYLPKADLSGADLRKAKMGRVWLVDANLRNADLGEADLEAAILDGADLCGANLAGANLEDAEMVDIKYDSTTKWPDGFRVEISDAINVDEDEA